MTVIPYKLVGYVASGCLRYGSVVDAGDEPAVALVDTIERPEAVASYIKQNDGAGYQLAAG